MFPASRSFLDLKVLAKLSSLPLLARGAMQGNISGRHTSPHRGSSVEFAEYRKYVPGDDLRRLDWRAYGRTDRYYVKEFEADTNLRCCFLLDTSGSMAFGSKGSPTKLFYAQCLAGTLAYLASQQGDAVGITLASESVDKTIPARRSPAHLKILLDTLEQVQCQGKTELPNVLHQIAETLRQRAMVVVLSYLFVQPELLQSAWEHLRFRKHDVVVFHLLDRQEIDFRFQRPVKFLDMEGGSSLLVDPAAITGRYQTALSDYLDQTRRIARETGVDYQQVVTDEPFEAALSRFLLGRINARGAR